MDITSKSLIILVLSGAITLCIGSSYIPQTGGTIPQGESPEDFSNKQQQEMYKSNGFKITMVGTGITIVGVLMICIRSCIEEYRTQNIPQKEPRSILKVTRATVVPQEPIEVIVHDQKTYSDPKPEADPRPQIRTTPNLVPLAAPPLSSSPPIQLIAHPKNVQRVNFMELQPVRISGPHIQKFRYPPPYHVLNRH